MNMQELLDENYKLKEKIKELENLLQRKSGSSSRAYDEIRAMIINKVDKEIEKPEYLEEWQKKMIDQE